MCKTPRSKGGGGERQRERETGRQREREGGSTRNERTKRVVSVVYRIPTSAILYIFKFLSKVFLCNGKEAKATLPVSQCLPV